MGRHDPYCEKCGRFDFRVTSPAGEVYQLHETPVWVPRGESVGTASQLMVGNRRFVPAPPDEPTKLGAVVRADDAYYVRVNDDKGFRWLSLEDNEHYRWLFVARSNPMVLFEGVDE